MAPELLYFTDPYCIWCFGFASTIDRIAKQFQSVARVRAINGGMIPEDVKLSDFFGRFPDPFALHDRVTLASGREFGELYLREIKNFRASSRVLNSTIPSRAASTLKLLGVSDDVGVAGAIQNINYVEGFDLQRIESYRSVAEEFDVDFDVFMSKFPSLPVGQAIVEERKLTAALGIQGFPALVLKTGDREFEMVARGFMSESHLKAILEAALKRFPAQGADQSKGQVCSLEGGSC